jgi:hypothetical protein
MVNAAIEAVKQWGEAASLNFHGPLFTYRFAPVCLKDFAETAAAHVGDF